MILDLYAGMGGFDHGLWSLGVDHYDILGLEIDADACATRAAAGYRTVRADITAYPCEPFVGKVDGLVASPPCQDFSVAGLRAGRTGDRGRLIDTVPLWVDELRPRWLVCEQVPPALVFWNQHAEFYETEFGYRCWTGLLTAADYGIPQTRTRAFLFASLDGDPTPPPTTHARRPHPVLFGDELKPWATMADALGWHGTVRTRGERRPTGGNRFDADQPSWTLTEKARSWDAQVDGDEPPMSSANWWWTEPATTVAGDPRLTARNHHYEGEQGRGAVSVVEALEGAGTGREPLRITVRDALILQSFPPDYPMRGTRSSQFQQIGNAVPPRWAAQLLERFVR